MELTTVWFLLVAVLFTGYFILEGFDFGVGMLLPVLGRDHRERRVLINTIGPVWDGNEVWLITAGGAMFAAFPEWYATLFSGFYLPLLLILLAAYAGKSLHTHPDEYYRYLTENDANTTAPALVDDCAICHFHFFSYIHSTDWVLDSEFRLLETFFRPECYDPAIVAISGSQLRAPPAIG